MDDTFQISADTANMLLSEWSTDLFQNGKFALKIDQFPYIFFGNHISSDNHTHIFRTHRKVRPEQMIGIILFSTHILVILSSTISLVNATKLKLKSYAT